MAPDGKVFIKNSFDFCARKEFIDWMKVRDFIPGQVSQQSPGFRSGLAQVIVGHSGSLHSIEVF